ncbi:MAG: anti-sigma factor family protein, partial [Anaerolineales bacterium]
MSEPSQVSNRDTEKLSAYLDGRLERSEAARLEARLGQEPPLRLELQELRATVRVLSTLPQIQPPRSFTLQPQAVGRRTGYPFLQLGTALATLSFLVVVGADLLVSRTGLPMQAESREFAAPAVEPEAAAEAPALDQQLGLSPEATPAAAQSDLADDAQAQAAAVAPTGTAPAEELKYRAGEESTVEAEATGTAAALPAAAEEFDEASAPSELAQEAELQASADRVSDLGGQE